MIYAFAGYRLDTSRYVLLNGGREIPVEPQVFDLLKVLAERAGQLVTRDDLIEAVWGGRIVSETAISARINAARVAVGDNGKDQAIIRTIPRRGFEMIAAVTAAAADPGPDAAPRELRQTIRYTSAPDGLGIAWAQAGSGPPLLYGWHHLSHLEKDWHCQLLARGLQSLAERHRLIRYDIRGSGLSDRVAGPTSIEDHLGDMLAVADAAGLERFPVVGVLQNAAVAVLAAARHPERISRLVLINGYARGRALREGAPLDPDSDPFVALMRSGGWGNPANGFTRAWATIVLPGASVEQTTELIELFAQTGSAEEALFQRNVIDHFDVTGALSQVRCPTLVIHARSCPIHPVQEGRRVAAGIPGAEFLELDSPNTFFIDGDPVLDQQIAATLEFLAGD